MVNVSGGMAAATLLLAAAVMAPSAMGYTDFEVSNGLKLLLNDPNC